VTSKRIRVLVAKVGLDGHDRGAKIIARTLRDAGMEVVYTGIRQTPAMIAEAALQEDVDVVGISILSGAHKELLPRIVDELGTRGRTPNDVILIVGGIIPEDDIQFINDLGFRGIFGPGSDTDLIAQFIVSEMTRTHA
jgi:methylmalonyl-CoA mutase C-terminal domain/subunit